MIVRLLLLTALLVGSTAAVPARTPMVERLVIDARDAPNQVWHASLQIPIDDALVGGVTLAFPKWKPGNHAPTGQVANLGMLRATVAGTPVPWVRDPNDLYTFRFSVPPGAAELDVAYDLYEGLPTGGDMSANIGILDWNQVVFAPAGVSMDDVMVSAQIDLPSGWSAATALPLATPAPPFGMPAGRVAFAPVSLETLIDSPLYCGDYERVVPLTAADGMTNEVDLFGESPADIEPTAAQVARWQRLVTQADRLFGARHWRHYHFLLSLSDTIPPNGVEHHESSADRLPERYLTDVDLYRSGARLAAARIHALVERQVSPARGPDHRDVPAARRYGAALGLRRSHRVFRSGPQRA